MERTIKVRSLDVHIQGRERVVIDPPIPATYAPAAYHKAHYASTNEMLNIGLRLLEDTILPPGDRDLPFQFTLPIDALPSYVGTYAAVNWKLSARADIPWGSDLSDVGYLRVLSVHSEKPGPVSTENPEASPKLKLELPTNIFQPGDLIGGKLTLLEPGNLRTVRLQIIQNEDATARGTLNNAHKTQNRTVGTTLEIRKEALPAGSITPFQLQLPPLAPSGYKGVYSSVSWWLAAVLDIPHADDIHLYAPFLVGLKEGPVAHPQAPMTTQTAEEAPPSKIETPQIVSRVLRPTDATGVGQTEVSMTAASTLSPAEEERMEDALAAIIQILGDGSSKDLLTISTELQLRVGEFLDLNQVKKLCEDLVSQGKLRRTAEGEFFAKYSLSGSAPQQ